MKILIVDDVYNNRYLIKKMLEKMDVTMVEATNGMEVIQFLEDDSSVDLIFMDIEMPKMDGIQATKVIKERRPYIKIIFQTACATYTNIDRIKRVGDYRVIEKPLVAEDIREAVGSLEKA